MYEGGLAKNIVDNESKTREMEFEINNKSLNMKFGENSSMQMVVIKVLTSSSLFDQKAVIAGSRLLSLNGHDCSSKEKLQATFRKLGAERPVKLKVLVSDSVGGFVTENAAIKKREEREVRVDGRGGELNFYEVLGVERGAKVEEIRDAFRRQSLKQHPDKGGSEEAFRNVQTAFKVLFQPSSRAKYDNQRRLHPFIAAAQNSDIQALRQFDTDAFTLTNSADSIVDRHGSNALHYAAGYGASIEVVAFLIDECNIHVDCTTKVIKHQASSRTPLHWAARNGHLEICKYLIGRGGDPTKGTSDGTSAVHWSLWNEHKETCEYLISEEIGMDINVVNSFRCNAGHFIGLNGNVGCMRFFAERGGDLRLRNNQGHSCIHKAAWRGRMELLRYLLDKGGIEREEFFRADENGYTPGDIANLGGQDEVVEWLREIEKE